MSVTLVTGVKTCALPILDRRNALIERPRRIDIGRVLPVVGRALLDLRFLGAGDADDIVADDEIAQFGNLLARGGDRAFGRLVRLHLRRARDDRRAGGDLSAPLLQRGLVLGELDRQSTV